MHCLAKLGYSYSNYACNSKYLIVFIFKKDEGLTRLEQIVDLVFEHTGWKGAALSFFGEATVAPGV